MDNLTYVLKRIDSGATARFLLDYYGGEIVEIERGWLRGRVRLRLGPGEAERVKQHLRNRRGRTDGKPLSLGRRFMRMLSPN